jgi:hypothetical protein
MKHNSLGKQWELNFVDLSILMSCSCAFTPVFFLFVRHEDDILGHAGPRLLRNRVFFLTITCSRSRTHQSRDQDLILDDDSHADQTER